MPGRSRRLKELDQELLALREQAMMVEEFDGFVAGLLVCPDPISPNDWLPIVWNRENDPQTPFDDIDHANRIFGLIMDHYNDVVLTLMRCPERYRPLFPVDRSEVLWEVWIEGFAEAVNLRPSAWQKLLDADPGHGRGCAGNADARRGG